MDDLRPLPIIVLGLGVLLIWGGLTGQSPVRRIKAVLTRGGVQSGKESSTVTVSTATAAGSHYLA